MRRKFCSHANRRSTFQRRLYRHHDKRFRKILYQVAEIVEIDKKNVASQSSILKDPDDNVIVELVGKADYIISGDKDLLDLMVFEKTKIVSVDQLLEILS